MRKWCRYCLRKRLILIFRVNIMAMLSTQRHKKVMRKWWRCCWIKRLMALARLSAQRQEEVMRK